MQQSQAITTVKWTHFCVIASVVAGASLILRPDEGAAYNNRSYKEMCHAYAEAEDWHNAFFYCRESAYAGDKISRLHYIESILAQKETMSSQMIEEGARLSLNAAREGDVLGYLYAGKLHQAGNFPDYEAALRYFMKAYEAGNEEAIVRIAMLYYGAQKLNDIAKATEWFKLGSDKNIREAQYGLGLIYHERGDHVKAAKSFNAAAENGDPQAMVAMARFFANGTVFKRDTIKAIRWYKLAIRAGREDVRPELTQMLSDFRDEERIRLLHEREKKINTNNSDDITARSDEMKPVIPE